MKNRVRFASILCVLAGTCDGMTGLLLVAAPGFTLRLMHITAAPTESIYMRWIGVFVFSVGCAYGLPFISRNPTTRLRRLISVMEFTALIRACVAIFVAVAVWRGALVPGWMTVVVTDALLAAIQLSMLSGGALESAAP